MAYLRHTCKLGFSRSGKFNANSASRRRELQTSNLLVWHMVVVRLQEDSAVHGTIPRGTGPRSYAIQVDLKFAIHVSLMPNARRTYRTSENRGYTDAASFLIGHVVCSVSDDRWPPRSPGARRAAHAGGTPSPPDLDPGLGRPRERSRPWYGILRPYGIRVTSVFRGPVSSTRIRHQ